MGRMLAISLLGLLLGGCGWVNSYFVGTDNLIPPADLQPIADPQNVQERWRTNASTGSGTLFTALEPAEYAGRLVVAGHRGDVTALDSSTGRQIWRINTNTTITAGVGLDEQLALVGTLDGQVIALDQADGSERWRSRVASEVLATPVADQGVVVVRSVDGTITGLDARDGTRLWGYNTILPTLTLRGTSKPLLTRGLAIIGLDNGKLLLLDLPTGAPVGERVIALPRGRTEVERLVDIDGTLQLVDNLLYVAAFRANVTAIDLRSGDIAWVRDLPSNSGLAVAGNQVLVVDTEDTVWSLDRNSGSVLWQQPELRGRRLSTPVAVGSQIVVGDFEGYLHWMDTANGRLLARTRTDNQGLAETPLLVGETLYVLGRSGQLHALGARPWLSEG